MGAPYDRDARIFDGCAVILDRGQTFLEDKPAINSMVELFFCMG